MIKTIILDIKERVDVIRGNFVLFVEMATQLSVSPCPTPTAVSIPPSIPDNGATLPSSGQIDFGPNVLVFDPSMSCSDIQSQVDTIFQMQQSNQFGAQRYALLFKPGNYSVDVQVGFYTTVIGLGSTPDAVTITGGINALAAWFDDNATQNFWRGVENLAIVPTVFANNTVWATSQATWLRRVHIHGNLWLFDYISPGPNNDSSGGFIADSVIDLEVQSGSQQQYLTRNTQLTNWQGEVWNMVFVGDLSPPTGKWPTEKISVIPNTPVIREKPYITVDKSNDYQVIVPGLKQNSQGPSWCSCGNSDPSTTGPTLSILHCETKYGQFYHPQPCTSARLAFAFHPRRLYPFATYCSTKSKHNSSRPRFGNVAAYPKHPCHHCGRCRRRHDCRIAS